MFITIRTYNSHKKAEYIKYRLELAGIECKTIPKEKTKGLQDIFKVDVFADHVEKAIQELLNIALEYPNEDFELKTDPSKLLHILIPIDFSEKSFEACKYAIDIAKRRPVEIKFLHVWNDEISDFMAARDSYNIKDYKRIQRNEIKRDINNNLDVFRQKLRNLIEETGTRDNLLYHFTVAEGMVYRQIEKSVHRYKPHLIIVAHNTDKECRFRISREIANEIINLAYCPVYYIPQKVFFKPFEKLHIMYATNFDKNVYKSFQNLQQLSIGYNTNIYIIHVVHEGSDQEAQEKLEKLVKELEEAKTNDIKIYTDVLNNRNLLKGFEGYIKNNQIDMLSITSPEYGVWHKLFNPDNLKTLMKGSTLPLLVFRYKE